MKRGMPWAAYGLPNAFASLKAESDMGIVGTVLFEADAIDDRPYPRRGVIEPGRLPVDNDGVPVSRTWKLGTVVPIVRCVEDSRHVWAAVTFPVAVHNFKAIAHLIPEVKVCDLASCCVGRWSTTELTYRPQSGVLEFSRPLPGGTEIALHWRLEPEAKS